MNVPFRFLLTGILLASLATAQSAAEKERALRDTGLTAEEDARRMTRTVSKKKAVMVLPVRASVQVPGGLLERSTEVLSSSMIQLGRFKIVDRAAMQKALQQQALSATGLIPEDRQTQMGKIVGATENVSAEITSYKEELKETVSEGGVAANVLMAALGVGGNQQNVTEKKWAIYVDLSVIHRDLDTGKVIRVVRTSVSTLDKEKAKAQSDLDERFEQAMTKALRDLFPLQAFVVRAEGRDVTIRFGQDMGIRPGMKFFLYTNVSPDPKNDQPTGEIRVREVFPRMSLAELRIRKAEVKEGQTVKERNTADVQLALAVGLAPFRVNFDSISNMTTYASAGSWFGLANWADRSLFDKATGTSTLGLQASLSASKELGSSAIDLKLSGLATPNFGAYAAKLLLGYKLTVIDVDLLAIGFGAHLGGAMTAIPVGTFKPGWYAVGDDGSKTTRANALITMLGATVGGEASVQAGINWGYDKRVLLEAGYAYYVPMNRLFMASFDEENKLLFLNKFFETSRVDPVDLSGLFASVSINFLF